jgi:hypothetical protein
MNARSTPRDGGAASDEHARSGHRDLDLGEAAAAGDSGESVDEFHNVRLVVGERS